MQVQVETTSGLERKVTVELPASQIDSEVDQRLKKATKTVRIDGFRKGKVPLSIVKKRYGDGIRQEVINDAINKSFDEAVQSQSLKTAGAPKIESIDDQPGETFKYIALLEVYPEIELEDLAKVEVESYQADVSDGDIDQMIDTLRKQNSDWELVARAAQDDDLLTVDYEGTIDGEAFEGGSAESTTINIGSGRLIPGFEDGLTGVKAGEEKVLDLQFPDDYHAEELKGKAVQFKVNVKEVKERKLPEVDAEFIAKFGVEGDSEEAFRVEVRENMERELKSAKLKIVKSGVMDSLVDLHPVDIPKSLIENEVGKLKQEMFQQYGGEINVDLNQIPDEPFTERAERRVRLGLIMSALVESTEIKPNKDRVDAEIKEIASTYQEPEEVEKYYRSNSELLQNVQMKVLEDQIVDHILTLAKVDEKTADYEEVLAKSQQNV